MGGVLPEGNWIQVSNGGAVLGGEYHGCLSRAKGPAVALGSRSSLFNPQAALNDTPENMAGLRARARAHVLRRPAIRNVHLLILSARFRSLCSVIKCIIVPSSSENARRAASDFVGNLAAHSLDNIRRLFEVQGHLNNLSAHRQGLLRRSSFGIRAPDKACRAVCGR